MLGAGQALPTIRCRTVATKRPRIAVCTHVTPSGASSGSVGFAVTVREFVVANFASLLGPISVVVVVVVVGVAVLVPNTVAVNLAVSVRGQRASFSLTARR